MEDFLVIGPLQIPTKWLYIGLVLVVVYIVINILLKKTTLNRKAILEIYTNALFYGFIIWKFSYPLFNPLSALKHPLGIIYFDGGQKGVFLGIFISFAYVYYQFLKQNIKVKPYLELFLKRWRKNRKNNIRNLISVVILASLIGLGIVDIIKEVTKRQINQGIGEEIGLIQGNQAPDFELKTLEGITVKLSDYKGKKVILNFWATWCPPCKAEMPHMQEYYDKNKENGVTILAVNLTKQERNENKVRPFVYDEFKLTFPVVLDINGEIGAMYQAYSIPTTYFIDTNGIVQNKIIGPLSFEKMETMVNNMR